ncbi:MAG: HlyD family efflux transporter periplasmic adaptor subunit, partial [Eubacteriales bacterium]|nr:HlyD family efflux transporter periplasmic adaptor subunit [Eubacteriales bacterium]
AKRGRLFSGWAKTEQEKVVSSISAELELKSIRDAINQAQAKVDKLEKENIGATVVSPVDGTVTSLSYTAGETTSPDSAAAIIRIDGKKLTVSFSATKEQAQKLKTGDEAQPVNPWEYDDDFKAVLRQITADSSDPQNSRLLKFEIDSDAVTAGDSVSLQIAESTKTYDLVVPNAAVRQDSNGFYVLLLQVRQSPLGNRYIVAREGIKVLAKDDTNSAISGSIGAYSYVITTSTRMVTSGDQVRLANDVEVEDSY